MSMTLKYVFPNDDIYSGIMLGNGCCGLLIWGGGNELKISVAHSNLWDHRGGVDWSSEMNYFRNLDRLQNGEFKKVESAFASSSDGGADAPSLIPAGRLCIKLKPACHLVYARLDMSSGLCRVFFQQSGKTGELQIRISMRHLGVTLIRSKAVESVKVSPAYELCGDTFKKRGFAPPQAVKNGFVQMLPSECDEAYVMTAGQLEKGTFFTALALTSSGAEPEQVASMTAGVSWAQVEADNREYWDKFWHRVPDIALADKKLEQLYYSGLFKFGSMTSSTGYPAGLQGAWLADHELPPWSGDFHFNINVQMVYSPALAANLADYLLPLFKMIWSWRERLRFYSKCLTGIDDGYMLPHAVDNTGVCMGDYWTGSIDHGCTLWVAAMMFRYFDYSSDIKFMRTIGFEFMRGTMNCCLAMLDKSGDNWSLPLSISPEYGDAKPSGWGANSSFQLSAIRRLAEDLLTASERLKIVPEAAWLEVLQHLPEATLSGDASEIALWEGQMLEKSHRHHSHLAGIVPFDTFDLTDPKWEAIVKKSFERWTMHGMGAWAGWSFPWAAQLHCHTNNAPMAEFMLHLWLKFFYNSGGGSMYSTAFPGFSIVHCRERIMQLDGIMGAVAALQDMLLHCRRGIVHVMSGIPENWKFAKFKDMPLPNSVMVSAVLRDGQLQKIELLSTKASSVKIALLPSVESWHLPGNAQKIDETTAKLTLLPEKTVLLLRKAYSGSTEINVPAHPHHKCCEAGII